MITESDKKMLCNLIYSAAVDRINEIYNTADKFETRKTAELWGEQHIIGMTRGIASFAELINTKIMIFEQKEE